MKLKPETSADFGIPYTGKELKEFNKKFSKHFPEFDNAITTKAKTTLYITGIVCFAANMLISCWKAPGALLKAIMAAPPVMMMGVVLYACFMKDKVCKTRIRYIALCCQFFLFFPIGVTALTGFKLLDYVIYIFSMVIGVFIGLNGWSKKAMKDIAVDADEAKKNDSRASSIGMIVAAALVPVIRLFVGSAGRTAAYIFLGLALSFLCVMFGWVLGVGIGNVRYYRFINKKK